jgi:malonyl-CoA O-methyltransferase
MHDIGDMLVRAGFADPVMDMELITVTYADAGSLLRELKALGAVNATRGRSRGLLGRNRFARVQEALASRARDGRIPATFEVVYGHAWKGAPKLTAEGLPIVRVEGFRRGGGAP